MHDRIRRAPCLSAASASCSCLRAGAYEAACVAGVQDSAKIVEGALEGMRSCSTLFGILIYFLAISDCTLAVGVRKSCDYGEARRGDPGRVFCLRVATVRLQ